MRECSVVGCNNPHKALGYCDKHWMRLRRTGKTECNSLWDLERHRNEDEKLWEKVYKTHSCWFWLGACYRAGYGSFSYCGKIWKTHRLVYTLLRGPIPKGYFVLHSCDTPQCVNPNHLALGDCGDNLRDCANKGRNEKNSRKEITRAWREQVSDAVAD